MPALTQFLVDVALGESSLEGTYICGHCGKETPEEEAVVWFNDFVRGIWTDLFKIPGYSDSRGVLLPNGFPQELCVDCCVKLTPWVQRFADIQLVKTFNGWLYRAILQAKKESGNVENRRAKDYGAIANYARECSEGNNEWRLGYRQG